METFFYSLILAAIGGLGFLCYNRPYEGKKICKYIMIAALVLIIILGLFEGGFQFGCEEYSRMSRNNTFLKDCKDNVSKPFRKAKNIIALIWLPSFILYILSDTTFKKIYDEKANKPK